MKTSDAGIAFIKQWEGSERVAYDDGGGVWTLGVGHTRGVKKGDTASNEQIDAWLREDLADAEAAANAVKVALTQNQFDALTSLAFNIGSGAFGKSTLVRLLNAGDVTGAAAQFPRWNKDGGRAVKGLTNRRAAERALFLKAV